MQFVQPTVDLYNLSNYSFNRKAVQFEKDANVKVTLYSRFHNLELSRLLFQDRFLRMEVLYQTEGMRRTVEGVLLVHHHNSPHILLIKIGNFHKLPGGKVLVW